MDNEAKVAHMSQAGLSSSPDDYDTRLSANKDIERDHVDSSSDLGSTSFYIDPNAERRVVRKLDFHLLPLLALMYFLNSLDHSNMGNAKTDGLEKTLGLVSNQYNIALSLFYITYVLTGPLFGIIGKIYGPHIVLPWRTLSFGLVTLLFVAVRNFGGLCAVRVVLGLTESAFFPIVIYYLTLFYRRGELAIRLAFFHTGQDLANAFAGLLSFGLFRITGTNLASWRYLFLVEGCATLAIVPLAFWLLPASADHCRFLDKSEQEIAHHRIQVDSSAIVNEPFKLREALKIFKHPTTWVYILIEFCVGIPLQSVQNFLNQIIKRIGYGKLETNLHSVYPNITGAVVLVLLSWGSDKTRLRFPFIAFGFLLTFIGFMVYVSLPNFDQHHDVAFFATFLMVWGASAPSVILDAWFNNNIADENKRILLTSVAVPCSNLMGVVSSNMFINADAPEYIPALSVSAAFGGLGIILTIGMGCWMMYDNKRRDARQGVKLRAQDIPSSRLRDGPASPTYRWFI